MQHRIDFYAHTGCSEGKRSRADSGTKISFFFVTQSKTDRSRLLGWWDERAGGWVVFESVSRAGAYFNSG